MLSGVRVNTLKNVSRVEYMYQGAATQPGRFCLSPHRLSTPAAFIRQAALEWEIDVIKEEAHARPWNKSPDHLVHIDHLDKYSDSRAAIAYPLWTIYFQTQICRTAQYAQPGAESQNSRSAYRVD